MENIDPEDFNQMSSYNAEQLLKTVFPELTTPLDEVFKIMDSLATTHINYELLPRVLRGVNNIMSGSGDGEVVVHVRKGKLTVETKERQGEIQVRNLPE